MEIEGGEKILAFHCLVAYLITQIIRNEYILLPMYICVEHICSFVYAEMFLEC